MMKKYMKEVQLRKQYYNEIQDMKGNIRVFVRVRKVRAVGRSSSPQWGSIQVDSARSSARTYAPCGPSVRVDGTGEIKAHTHPNNIVALFRGYE